MFRHTPRWPLAVLHRKGPQAKDLLVTIVPKKVWRSYLFVRRVGRHFCSEMGADRVLVAKETLRLDEGTLWASKTLDVSIPSARVSRTSRKDNILIIGVTKWTRAYWFEVEDRIAFESRGTREGSCDDGFPHIRIGAEDLVDAKAPIEMAHFDSDAFRKCTQGRIMGGVRVMRLLHQLAAQWRWNVTRAMIGDTCETRLRTSAKDKMC